MGCNERNLQPQKTMILCSIEKSPFGDLLMASEEGKLIFSSFIENKTQSLKELGFYLKLREWKLVEEEMHQPIVQGMINNKHHELELLLDPEGTTFQKSIWEELMKIPAGETRTLYSLRHSSMTFRLLYGRRVDLLTLARNARTSVEMVEKFYSSNLTSEMNIDLLQGKRKKS